MSALIEAVKDGSKFRMKRVLGPDADEIVDSGDDVADEETRQRFLSAYNAKHSFSFEGNKKATIVLGADDFPFPIPLIHNQAGWEFDSAAGRREILYRRIGRNELDAIQTSLAFVDAQIEYADRDRTGDGPGVYAQRIVSSPGKKDGLFWRDDRDPSPLGELAARAEAEGYKAGAKQRPAPRRATAPYHGYYYRILKAQGSHAPDGALSYVVKGKMIGGFALIAYPADYGNSGVMTFVVNHGGTVYEKDFGTRTDAIAKRMVLFDPDHTWKKVDVAGRLRRETGRCHFEFGSHRLRVQERSDCANIGQFRVQTIGRGACQPFTNRSSFNRGVASEQGLMALPTIITSYARAPMRSVIASRHGGSMSDQVHPQAPHHLPAFITAPGDTDILMVVVGVILIGAILLVGNIYLRIHSLPERMAHKSQKLQFEIVAVLGLLALFTHIHLFWIAALLLAMIDLPDFSTPLRSIAVSVAKMAGVPIRCWMLTEMSHDLTHGAEKEDVQGRGNVAKAALARRLPAKTLLARAVLAKRASARVRCGIMLELMLCSLLTIFPDYLYRRYGQGKRIGKEITLYSVWFELRWGITACVMLTVALITVIFYFHPSTTTATLFFRNRSDHSGRKWTRGGGPRRFQCAGQKG